MLETYVCALMAKIHIGPKMKQNSPLKKKKSQHQLQPIKRELKQARSVPLLLNDLQEHQNLIAYPGRKRK